MPVIAVLHHLEQPFLGHAAVLGEVADLEERSLNHGDPLPDLEAVDGIVSLGGEQTITDVERWPFLVAEGLLLREATERGIPVLGVCLGGQLLAHALGGRVRHAGRRVEWRELHPLDAADTDPLFRDQPDPVPALHWNEDVFDPPAGAVELLGGGGPGCEAFRMADSAWAVQYHPDADETAVARWLEQWPEQVARIDTFTAESARRAGEQAAASQALFRAFGAVVAGVTTAAG
jgi:GMP synthase (glutamine-hydrolysing)